VHALMEADVVVRAEKSVALVVAVVAAADFVGGDW
jgi:hypothetical protein